jgi:hypothetical protein
VTQCYKVEILYKGIYTICLFLGRWVDPDSDREIIKSINAILSCKSKRIFTTRSRLVVLGGRNYVGDMGSSTEHEAGNEKGKVLKMHDYFSRSKKK